MPRRLYVAAGGRLPPARSCGAGSLSSPSTVSLPKVCHPASLLLLTRIKGHPTDIFCIHLPTLHHHPVTGEAAQRRAFRCTPASMSLGSSARLGMMDWRAIFAARFRLQRNWRRGRCSMRTFAGHRGVVTCLQFDDDKIVSGSSDSTIKVWSTRTNAPWSVFTLLGHSDSVRCLVLRGNMLVSGSNDTTIKVREAKGQSVHMCVCMCVYVC